MTDRRSRPPRLTEAEWAGLWGALIALQGEVEQGEETDPVRVRELRAAERALRKIARHGIAPRPHR